MKRQRSVQETYPVRIEIARSTGSGPETFQARLVVSDLVNANIGEPRGTPLEALDEITEAWGQIARP